MRALARWGITPLLAAPVGAWALGLGDIELQSALNQPFKAQIALAATPEELQGLRISLAAPEAFQRYGIDRPAFLSALEFRIVGNRDGRSIIEVTSRQSIGEPFVTLLVEATWPRGRTLREYTVLLDPPVLLPAPAVPPAVRPAETRAPAPSTSGGAISRSAPPPVAAPPPAPSPAPAPAPAPTPRVEAAPGPVSANPPPAPRAPAATSGANYGPVRRAETLWAIADRLRPEGVSVNQMMIALYRSNPEAFRGNINVLRAGSLLRLPEPAEFDTLTATVANMEVQRHTDEWRNRSSQGGQLRLLPPTEPEVARAPTAAPTQSVTSSQAAPAAPSGAAPGTAVDVAPEANNRPVEINNAALQNLQQSANVPAAVAPETPTEPGVDLERQGAPVFADEAPGSQPTTEQLSPAAAPTAIPAAANEPSLLARILSFVLSPLLWIGLGVAALLLAGLRVLRRRRLEAAEEPEAVTGRWDAMAADEEEVRDATARMRRRILDESIVVEEGDSPARAAEAEQKRARRAAPISPAAPAATRTEEDALSSSQRIMSLDSADVLAEADFHMAYGLYDQAAELVQKAIDAAPKRRDLKLKLLEVFFVWGNKDAFLESAQALRRELGDRTDADWNKIVIMGRQICPDAPLFAEATTGAGSLDLDLGTVNSALDLAFDDLTGSVKMADIDFSLDVDSTADSLPGQLSVASDRARGALEMGARTAAGLEAAMFEEPEQDAHRVASTTLAEAADDALSVTQESPTIERSMAGRDWASIDAPSVETPLLTAAAADALTMETLRVETPHGRTDSPDVEQSAMGATDHTAEIHLDDLGLDVKDLEDLPTDFGDLPMDAGKDSDTQEQPALDSDDPLLSASGVTKVLQTVDDVDVSADEEFDQRLTSILDAADAKTLLPPHAHTALVGTEVIEDHFTPDDSGDTSLVKSLARSDDLDLELAVAVHGGDTVEQPRPSTFLRHVFNGGDTPLDLDIGTDIDLADDAPTGTEDVRSLDPQTMTEIGTKLDLARAYIDMGDPEGARSILEEVLDEGDPSQRREAQGLLEVLSA